MLGFGIVWCTLFSLMGALLSPSSTLAERIIPLPHVPAFLPLSLKIVDDDQVCPCVGAGSCSFPFEESPMTSCVLQTLLHLWVAAHLPIVPLRCFRCRQFDHLHLSIFWTSTVAPSSYSFSLVPFMLGLKPCFISSSCTLDISAFPDGSMHHAKLSCPGSPPSCGSSV
jgi:hypothetical protein